MKALERLDDYLRGHDAGEDVDAYEDDLFARALAGDAPELAFRAALGVTLREMQARGTIEPWLTAREVERLRTSSLRVVFLEYESLLGATIPDDAELVVTRVPIDLRGARRVDAEVTAPDGTVLKVMPEIRFDPADGAVWACCEADLARVAHGARTLTKVWAVDDEQRRTLIAELPI